MAGHQYNATHTRTREDGVLVEDRIYLVKRSNDSKTVLDGLTIETIDINKVINVLQETKKRIEGDHEDRA